MIRVKLLVFCSVAAVQFTCDCGTAQDHLDAEKGVLIQSNGRTRYLLQLRDLLLLDDEPRPIARVVCLPSFKPEWAATVIEREPDKFGDKHRHAIEYSTTGGNIWFAMQHHEPSERHTEVIPIDEATAQDLGEAWRRMLRRTPGPRDIAFGTMLHGIRYNFSCFDARIGLVSGECNHPEEGTLVSDLVEIGWTMDRLATAPETDREDITAELRARAINLNDRLRLLDREEPQGRSPDTTGGESSE